MLQDDERLYRLLDAARRAGEEAVLAHSQAAGKLGYLLGCVDALASEVKRLRAEQAREQTERTEEPRDASE